MNKVPDFIAHYYFKLRKYLITYRNGSLVIPFVANSPRNIVQSMAKIPFFKNSVNTIHSNSILAMGLLHYYELEKGFWNFISSTYHKKDVEYQLIFDPSLKAKYYALTCCLNNESSIGGELYTLENKPIATYTWSMHKPGASLKNKSPKGNTVIFYVLYFTEEWLQKNILQSKISIRPEISNFLASEKKILLSDLKSPGTTLAMSTAKNIIQNNGEIPNKIDAKINALQILLKFFAPLDKDESAQENGNSKIASPNSEILRILNILHSFLYQPFPGLEYIAKESGMSTNSLITKFKKHQQATVFQYFRSKQLELAKKKLETEDILIKSVASSFGYQSVSKFSAAFKKEFGFLPSELKKEEGN